MLDTLKFVFFSIVALALFGLLGYWAVSHLQSGPEFAANQEIQQLKQENDALTKQVADLTSQLNTAQSLSQPAVPAQTTQNTEPASTPAASMQIPTQPTTYKYQSLVDKLQQLITANISMKLKSAGTRVGTVQDFLNIYNNTSNKIDNSYGTSTEKAVAAFQKAQGLTADGQAGSGTFSEMINWLKQQG
ncbi:MAG: peptidoglycan-binding protein [Candidatus Pacebacteria bacterium]|nr:peptidoglycan-binding protein [Candidatus Paceibacterota bacterium]